MLWYGRMFLLGYQRDDFKGNQPGRHERRLHGQAVKTSPFHGGNTGSIPVGVIFLHGAIAKW